MSLERLKKSFTIGTVGENTSGSSGSIPGAAGTTSALGGEQQQTDTSCDILGGYRPPSVTESCTNDIPETIVEEAETGLEGGARRLSNSRRIIADVVQSSSESNTSNISVSDGESRKTVSFSTDYQRRYRHEHVASLTGSTPERKEIHGGMNKVNNDSEINLLGDENDPAFQNLMNTNSVANSNNSKVKPMQGQSFEKAVGFLLESKARRNPKVVKRVKFN